jgi:hypothetical protein
VRGDLGFSRIRNWATTPRSWECEDGDVLEVEIELVVMLFISGVVMESGLPCWETQVSAKKECSVIMRIHLLPYQHQHQHILRIPSYLAKLDDFYTIPYSIFRTDSGIPLNQRNECNINKKKRSPNISVPLTPRRLRSATAVRTLMCICFKL